MSRLGVIITVPHAVCPENKPDLHLCDFVALRFASVLYQTLKPENLDLHYLPGDTSRDICDLNRDQPCGQEFRHKLQEARRSLGNQRYITLDIHSYPSSYYPYNRSLVTLLGFKKPETLLRLLMALKAQYLEASKVNFIIQQDRQNPLSPILIEINEDITPNQMTQVAEAIRLFLVSI